MAHWGPWYLEIRLTPPCPSCHPGCRCPEVLSGTRLSLFFWVAGDLVSISGRYVIKSFLFFPLKIRLQEGD